MTHQDTKPRLFEAVEQRVETGPIQFGDDWPGIFIRGDNALYISYCLQHVVDPMKEAAKNNSAMWMYIAELTNLIKLLESCDARTMEH